jgi:sugar phosphate isomerase/epimerase
MENKMKDHLPLENIGRRKVLQKMGLVSAGIASGMFFPRHYAGAMSDPLQGFDKPAGGIKQSLVSWNFRSAGDRWDLETLCRVARDTGCKSVELVGPTEWPVLAKYGLECAIGSSGTGFVRGLNNMDHQGEIIELTRKAIETAAEAPVKVHSVIAFTGFKYRNPDDPSSGIIPLEEGAENTIAGLKKLDAVAERHGINIYLEHLNSRAGSLGHFGYQGDDIDYCADIIRSVGSPRIKLLFDIYHVQIMNGDIISRIREFGPDLIGHIHTAGVPGRGELDENQEIQYRPVMKALADTGYKGFVGHEFVPTRDALEGIRQAIEVCSV